MKRILISALLGLGLISTSFADSSTKTIAANTMTNLLAGFNNPVTVQYVILTASGSNTTVLFYDTPTNAITYVNPAYTNTLSYATNWNTIWTNYYGVVQTNYAPIIALIDNTNNAVVATTNSYPIRLGVSALSNATIQVTGPFVFGNGCWATNTTVGPATVTIIYH